MPHKSVLPSAMQHQSTHHNGVTNHLSQQKISKHHQQEHLQLHPDPGMQNLPGNLPLRDQFNSPANTSNKIMSQDQSLLECQTLHHSQPQKMFHYHPQRQQKAAFVNKDTNLHDKQEHHDLLHQHVNKVNVQNDQIVQHSQPPHRGEVTTEHYLTAKSVTAHSNDEEQVSVSPSKKIRPNFIALSGRNTTEELNEAEKGSPATAAAGAHAVHAKNTHQTGEHNQNITRSAPVLGDQHGVQAPVHLNGSFSTALQPAPQDSQSGTNTQSVEPQSVRAPCKASKEGGEFLSKVRSNILSPDVLVSPCDSVGSLDTTPWNIDGTETIVENPVRKTKQAEAAPGLSSNASSLVEREMEALREENRQLKASLHEAGRLNAQWRAYHQERQCYVERLLCTIHTLQRNVTSTSPPNTQLKVLESGGAADEGCELKRLREALARAQAEHQEHVTLLQMQVRAHRDDWEAESAEKRLEKMNREEAEGRAALLQEELYRLQQKLSDSESRRSTCVRCEASLDLSSDHVYRGTPPALATRADIVPSNQQCHRQQEHAGSTISGEEKYTGSNNHISTNQEKLVSNNGQLTTVQDRFKIHCVQAPSDPSYTDGCNKEVVNSTQGVQTSSDARNQVLKENDEPNGCETRTHFNEQSTDPELMHFNNNQNRLFQQNDCISQNGEAVSVFPPKQTTDDDAKLSPGTSCQSKDRNTEDKVFSNNHPAVESFSGKRFQDRQNVFQRLNSTSAVSTNVPLKGWIPVSMMHQIAFGGVRETGNQRFSSCPGINNYVNDRDSVNPNNSSSPSMSRESSLASSASYEEPRSGHIFPVSEIYYGTKEIIYHDRTEGRPRTTNCRPTTFEDDQKKAKHRARNILTNALPVSPVSSGPSTPAGVLARIYMPSPLGTAQKNIAKPTTVQRRKNNGFEELMNNTLSLSQPEVKKDVSSEYISKDQDTRFNELGVCNAAAIAAENVERIIKIPSESNVQEELEARTDYLHGSENICGHSSLHSNQIPSTSNETSRSSSPGMSLTTFALTSEGRGIPGAICFSLHPDINPCINTGILSSAEPTSPKKDSTFSQVHIEPKSLRLLRSPVEISTKEHWWSVNEREHCAYPDQSRVCKPNGTLVNSTYVQLQDTGKRDSHTQQCTARAVSSCELARRRKGSQDGTLKNNDTKPTSNTSTTTFLFTPAVNSSPSSSELSSLESSKACSPPRHQTTHLKSMASKNIASAIISYEIAAMGDRIVYADRLKPCDIVSESPEPVANGDYTSSQKIPKSSEGVIDSTDPKLFNLSETTAKSYYKPSHPSSVMHKSNEKATFTPVATSKEVSNFSEVVTKPSSGVSSKARTSRPRATGCPNGVETFCCKEIICPSCQMLFPRQQHLLFLDHFETCKGPEFADL